MGQIFPQLAAKGDPTTHYARIGPGFLKAEEFLLQGFQLKTWKFPLLKALKQGISGLGVLKSQIPTNKV